MPLRPLLKDCAWSAPTPKRDSVEESDLDAGSWEVPPKEPGIFTRQPVTGQDL